MVFMCLLFSVSFAGCRLFFTSGLSLICRYEGKVTLDELLITLVFCHHTFVSGVWMGFMLFLKVSSLFLVRFFLARLASF
jgi:hypothetical protein